MFYCGEIQMFQWQILKGKQKYSGEIITEKKYFNQIQES